MEDEMSAQRGNPVEGGWCDAEQVREREGKM